MEVKETHREDPFYAGVKVGLTLSGEEIAGFVIDRMDPEASPFTDVSRAIGPGETVRE